MMFQISQAKREKVKLMIGLTGVSGAGKTYSALKIAKGLTGDWSSVYVADTENKSALYYADSDEEGKSWNHIPFSSDMKGGYHPANWIRLIEMVEKIPTAKVLILDSISHEWDGVGGCLDIHAKLGGAFNHWAKVTPLHNAFIDKLRDSRLHIIATMRSKQDYVVEQNEKGKSAPKKVGLKSNQREGIDYEFGIIFDIRIDHKAIATKDRTMVFSDADAKELGFFITEQTGVELIEWSNSGIDKPVQKPIEKQEAPTVKMFSKTDPEMVSKVKAFLASRKSEDKEVQLWGMIEGRPATMPIMMSALNELATPVMTS